MDATAPTITLLGANPLNLTVGDTYTDPGATASDNVDGNITGSIVVAGATVNTAVAGTYVVTYNVSDAAGNSAVELTRTVIVSTVDITAPIITLLGANPLNLTVGDTYTDPGATASDNIDGNITGSIVVAGATVNTAVAGTYVVTYNVNDAAGNSAVELTRSVIVSTVDVTAPIIMLLGANPLNLTVGDTYIDPGATASDNIDGNITGSIVVAGATVNTAVAGTYVVTYNVSDAAGNAATELTRTVTVAVNTPPVISSFSVSPSPAYTNAPATFSWGVNDANDDSLTCLLDVDNDGVNDYTINDCANTTSQAHTFSVAGDYTAQLTVSDGIATPVVTTLDFTVIAPLSTDVSVNGPAVAGERLRYTITVANATAQAMNGVAVSLVVPAELTFVWSADAEPNVSSGCSVCSSADEPVWDLGTLAAGESRTITVNALIDAATLNDATITLPVTFSATGGSNVRIDKVVGVFNTSPSDLSLSASVDPVVPGETFTWKLDFGNTGAVPLTTVELRAFLPPGITVSAISDGGSEVATGEVVWNTASLGVGASLQREVMVTADAGLAAGQILKASARLTHDGGPSVNTTAEQVVTVVSDALPLTVGIISAVNPVVADGRAQYTLAIGNHSLQPVDDVIVQLRVPAELSFHWATDAEPNVSSGCSLCRPGNESSWVLGTLAAGETRSIVVNATVGSVLSGNLISLPVRVTATGLGDTIDRLKTVAIYNSPAADLSLSASTDPVMVNESFTYRLDVGNTSAVALTTTELRAKLPAGVTVVSVSDGGTDVGNGEVTWSLGSLAVGESLHREIVVTADSGLAAGDILEATAQLTHDGGLAVDNMAEHALTVTSSALPLVVGIDAAANPVTADGRALYTITIGNSSALPVNDVTLQLRVPAELSFHWATDAEPDVTGGCSTCRDGLEPAWALGTLAAGEMRSIVVNATVGSVLAGNLIRLPVRVTATGLGDTIDRLKTLAVHNAAFAELSLGTSADAVVSGETFTWLLDVGNPTAGVVSGTQLRATLPAGVTVSSISGGGTDTGTGEVVWDLATLSAGASVHREIALVAGGISAGDQLPLQARLTADGGLEIDRQAEFTVTAAGSGGIAALFTVSLATTPQPVAAGATLVYTFTVTNGYGLPVDGVQVQMRVPPEVSFNWSTGAVPVVSGGCSTCTDDREARWDLGTLAAGASQTITINATVAAGLDNGTLIVAPVRVTATGMEDTIDLRQTTVISN